MMQELFSITGKCKKISEHILSEEVIKVPDVEGKLPHINHIINLLKEANERIGKYEMDIYHSNAIILNQNKEEKEFSVVIPKFQIENKYPDYITDKGVMKSIFTFEYKNNTSLEINACVAEEIQVCSNGLVIQENIIENKSKLNRKYGLERFVYMFLNKFAVEESVVNSQRYIELLSSKVVTATQEKEILGDLLKRTHTSKHVIDSSILLKAARYGDNKDNPFKSKNGVRTIFDFLQDFTCFMKTTDISTHINKNVKLTNYFRELCLQNN